MSKRGFVLVALGFIFGALVLNRILPDDPRVLPVTAVVFIGLLFLIGRARRERRGNSRP